MSPPLGPFRKIGVWQTAFLGDAVLTLPLIAALKTAWPGADIHFFVRAGLEPLFAAQPELSAVHGFAKRGSDRSLAAAARLGLSLRGQGFDLWISPHTSLRSAFIAALSGAPVRLGYDRPWLSALAYTHTVSRDFDRLEEIERLMRLLLPLGLPLDLDPVLPTPRLVLPGPDLEAARAWRAGRPGPLLGLHPGSTWPTKQWPLQFFADIIARASASGVATAVFGGPGPETDLAARIIAQAKPGPGPILNLAGTLSLPGLAAHLGLVDAYLTNDSGPMHLAWAQDTPVVALFGPTVRALGFYPRGPGSTVLELDLPCRPCGLHGHAACPEGHHACMLTLTPDLVWPVLAAKLIR